MIEPLKGLAERQLLHVAMSRLAEEPVVALQGPRTVGKSTLLRGLAQELGCEVLDLDDLATRDAVAADPGTFVAQATRACIDEFQHVPELLGAIKAELNRDLRPGRFLITGSTRYDALPLAARSLTGRLHVMTVWPLAQSEIEGTPGRLLATLFENPGSLTQTSPSRTSRTEYVERVARGGFPLALARAGESARHRWFDDYVRQVVERDVLELSRVRQREQLPRLLTRLAAQSGQLLNIAAAAAAVPMEKTTAENYVKLLEAVFLVYRLPAWGKTLRSRVSATPKVHLMDSGLAARLQRLTPAKLARLHPTSLTEFGHLLESFTVLELLKQASWTDGIAGWGHWRTHDGDEVDLVIERDDGAVVAFEVKAGGRVTSAQQAPLRRLRDAVGDAFVAGVTLYTGPRSYSGQDRLYVVPIDRLWTT